MYLRYKVTKDGVSTRALPGVTGATQLVNSYEHDEYGYGAQGEEPANRIAQNEKRMRKLQLARKLVPRPLKFGCAADKSDLSIVCFGSTKGPLAEAVSWLAADGLCVSVMQIVTLWPFPADEVQFYMDRSTRTMVVEGNITGQLEGLIRQECLRTFDWHINRYDGRPFSPEQVYETVRGVIFGARAE